MESVHLNLTKMNGKNIFTQLKPKRKYRFHYLGMYHLPVSERYQSCAYTQKIVKLCKMLLSLGHEVYLYGAETSDTPCTKFFETHTMKDIRQSWGDGDNRFELGYDKDKGWTYRYDTVFPLSFAHLKYMDSCKKLLKQNADLEHDFLLLPQNGGNYKSITDELRFLMVCEPGVGYGASSSRFRAFESQYIMYWTYGQEVPKGEYSDIKFYDRVIPNYFDPALFPFVDKEGKKDYYLYIGRTIARKGVHIAYRLAREMGKELLVAGQCPNDLDTGDGVLKYVGYADKEKRAKLMGEAKAVLVPTTYIEPFGGVNVEAQLCGTPVIATNGGAFKDTIKQGETGFTCDTFRDFVEAAKQIDKLDPKVIRKHAERYLMDNVRWEFQKWFDDIYDLIEATRNGQQEPWYSLD